MKCTLKTCWVRELFFQLFVSETSDSKNKTNLAEIQYYIVHVLYKIRGHSRNMPKGGRNSPKAHTSTHFMTIFFQFILTTSPVTASKNSTCCFYTKLHFNHCVRLVWRHKITNFLTKNCFCSVQRVVSRPPRPIARMAPGFSVVHSGERLIFACQLLRWLSLSHCCIKLMIVSSHIWSLLKWLLNGFCSQLQYIKNQWPKLINPEKID